MAKFVLAGKADCPYFARAELLGDQLTLNLPDFKFHKIIVQPGEWEKWLKDTCNERNWTHKKSPIIWRELIDRGGKGVLIGGANEFQEYANNYYGIESKLMSQDMLKIAKENTQFKIEIDQEEKEYKALSKPLQVCITNASQPACYAIINEIAKGDVFGENTEIALRLFDKSDKAESLEGLKMEAVDLAHGLLRNVSVISDTKKAFENCNAIILMDELEEAGDRSAWVKDNVQLFTTYAKVINEVANKNVKVLLTGKGPINLSVYMMINNAPNIPRQNFVGLSRLVENHAKSILAQKLNVNSSGIVDLVVWGNVYGDNFIDLETCKVHGYEGAIWGPPSFSLPVKEMVWDKQWLQTEFIEQVKNRTEVVQTELKHVPSMSMGAAVSSMIGHWWKGSPTGQIFSLAVCSEGWYDIEEGLVCSLPVTMHPKGYWNVVQDINLPEESKDRIKAVVQDIIKDKNIIFPPPTPPPSEVKVTIVDPKDSQEKVGQQEKGETESQEKKDSDGSSNEPTSDSGPEGDSASDPKLETIIEEKAST